MVHGRALLREGSRRRCAQLKPLFGLFVCGGLNDQREGYGGPISALDRTGVGVRVTLKVGSLSWPPVILAYVRFLLVKKDTLVFCTHPHKRKKESYIDSVSPGFCLK
jgi:hypothetical protein